MAYHIVDSHVGEKLRMIRVHAEVSQQRLGDTINVSFQQIQKYEKGANRISASKLYEICVFFECKPNFFFKGLDGM